MDDIERAARHLLKTSARRLGWSPERVARIWWTREHRKWLLEQAAECLAALADPDWPALGS
jgi:hypothetical protein